MFDKILCIKTPSTETIPDMHNLLSNLEKRKRQKMLRVFTTTNNRDKTNYFSAKLATVLG